MFQNRTVWFENFFMKSISVILAQCGRNNKFSFTEKNFVKSIFSVFYSKTVTFTEYLPQECEREFPQFPHCVYSGGGHYIMNLGGGLPKAFHP